MSRWILPAFFSLTLACWVGCTPSPSDEHLNLSSLFDPKEALEGKSDYLASPFVAAGDRTYLVGHQDGTFPDLGWHVTGEMGGIWNHPIKLLDGFAMALNGQCLPPSSQFFNYPYGNEHVYPLDSLTVRRFQFSPDGVEGVVVVYRFDNPSGKPMNLELTFTALIDLMPVWLSERQGLTDATDRATFDESAGVILAQDTQNPWFVSVGAHQEPEGYAENAPTCTPAHAGKGLNASLNYRITVPANGQTEWVGYIAGSAQSQQAALENFDFLKKNAQELLVQKKNRYRDVQAQTRLTVADPQLEKMFEWTKYNTQWLMREVPPIGRGLSAGLPDYPWWFGCDNAYTLQGALATGQHEMAKSTIRLIYELSEKQNGNGRVVHEVSTNGEVFNPGNLNETPQFAHLIWEYVAWTGDEAFARELYPFVKKGMNWLLAEQDADGNLCPDGAGMMEIHGLDSEMMDVVVYTQAGLAAAARLGRLVGDTTQAADFEQKAATLKARINEEWWVPQANSFADFRATKPKAIELVEGAIVRADTLGKPWAVAELKATLAQIKKQPAKGINSYVAHHNWVVNTPLEMGIADPEKALLALETAKNYSSPFGMYVTGIDRDEQAKDAKVEAMRKKIFSYVGAVMTLPTGVQAISEAQYGRPDEALNYLHLLGNSFGFALPGSLYEVSPDFGMFTQAWNLYAVAVPVVRHFFGIRPEAHAQRVTLRPHLPQAWPSAQLADVPVGNNRLSLDFGQGRYLIRQAANWPILLQLPEQAGKTVKVNGKALSPTVAEGYWQIELNGGENEVLVE